MLHDIENMNKTHIELWAGIEKHLGRFDLIICDLWGVMHDGLKLHTDAEAAIECARNAGVKTVFLSNAPRPRDYVRQHLTDMGLNQDLTDLVVTSGGLARDEVRDHFSGSNLYHIGPKSDHNTIEGLPVTLVDHPDKADVILATDLDFPDIERHRDYLQKAAANHIPFLCANPDRVVHVGQHLYYCAGAIADLYEAMGGTVRWYGKPVAQSFQACLKEVGMMDVAADRVLMIGDSLKTDITGAINVGFESLLITNGIHRGELSALTDNLTVDTITEKEFDSALGEAALVKNEAGETVRPTAIAASLQP